MKRLIFLLIAVMVFVALPVPQIVLADSNVQDFYIASASALDKIYEDHWVSQSFRPGRLNTNDSQYHHYQSSLGRYTLESVDMYLINNGMDNADVIYAEVYANVGDEPSGAALSSGDITVADLGNSVLNANYTTIPMPGCLIDIGCQYLIVLHTDEGIAGGPYVTVEGHGWSGYDGKAMYSDDAGANWSYQSVQWDFLFATYGYDIPTNAPDINGLYAYSYSDNESAEIYIDYYDHYVDSPYAGTGAMDGFYACGQHVKLGETLAYEISDNYEYYAPVWNGWNWEYSPAGEISFDNLTPDTHYYASVALGTPYDVEWTGGTAAFLWSDNYTFEFDTYEAFTDPATSVGYPSATLNGHVEYGLGEITGKAFEWNDTGDFGDSHDQWITEGSWTGDYLLSHAISEYDGNPLEPGVTYYFRIANRGPMIGEGWYVWVYGEVEEFTIPLEDPEVTTTAATSVTQVSGYMNGDLTDLGSADTVDVYFYWGYATGVLPNEEYADSLAAVDNFTFQLLGIAPGTTIFYVTYAVSAYGDAWGTEKSFTTLPALQPPEQLVATPVTGTEIELTWNNPNLNYWPTLKAIIRMKAGEYPDDPPVTTDNSSLVYQASAWPTGAHSYTVNGLTPGTSYYFRIWFFDTTEGYTDYDEDFATVYCY